MNEYKIKASFCGKKATFRILAESLKDAIESVRGHVKIESAEQIHEPTAVQMKMDENIDFLNRMFGI
jgi:hypothetical protein